MFKLILSFLFLFFFPPFFDEVSFFSSKLVSEIGYKPALCSFRCLGVGVFLGFFLCLLFSKLTANSGLMELFFYFLPNKNVEKNKGESLIKEQ